MIVPPKHQPENRISAAQIDLDAVGVGAERGRYYCS